MNSKHEHDYRINPFETVRSWPMELTATCVTCGEQRQVGQRGWTLRSYPMKNWPQIRFEEPKARDPDQLTLE